MEETLLYKVFQRYKTDICIQTVNKSQENTSNCIESYIDGDAFRKIILKMKKSGAKINDVSDDIINAVFMLFDKDCDNKLKFNEFEDWWNHHLRYKYFSQPYSRLLRNARVIYLTASKGKYNLNIEDLENYLQEKKIEYSDESVEAIDTDNSGNISFSEFGVWLNWF